MTRGTFFLLLPEKIIASREFNGDMYGSPKDSKELQSIGHYKLAVSKLREATDEKTFKEKIKEFDRQAEFNYQEEEYPLFEDLKYTDYLNENKEIDMKEDTYYTLFFSDYLYMKRLGDSAINIKDAEGKVIALEPEEIATFYFGEFIEKIK